MRKSLSIVITLCALLFSVHVNAALINVAPDGTATASSFFAASTPANAIDGDNTTVWNSGTFAPATITIDLGETIAISQITGLVEQTPNGNVRHDVFLDNILSFSWTGFSTTGLLFVHDFITPVAARTIRITTTDSPSWVAWREIQVFTQSNAIPVPATIWLFLSGLILLFINRRKSIPRNRNDHFSAFSAA